MNIGTRIKNTRIKKDITQERLAEYLNISVSAVSQWECGKTMPDISLLPILAGILDTTTDELLGVDLAKKQEEIHSIITEFDRLSNLGLEKEKFDYIKAAYQRFPTAPDIVDKYLWMLCYDPYHDNNGLLVHENEISNLCENILNESSEDYLRFTALSVMSSLYREKGKLDKALEYANRFPHGNTAEEEIENLYERGTDKWWEAVRSNIYYLTETLMVKIRNCALYAQTSTEERIRLFNKAITLLNLIYDDGDFGFAHYHLGELNIWISNRYIELDNYEKAAEYLEKGLFHAKTYDELPSITKHSSFLVKGYTFDSSQVYSGYSGNNLKRELDFMGNNKFYNKVRTMNWFEDIISKYKPFAKDHKNMK